MRPVPTDLRSHSALRAATNFPTAPQPPGEHAPSVLALRGPLVRRVYYGILGSSNCSCSCAQMRQLRRTSWSHSAHRADCHELPSALQPPGFPRVATLFRVLHEYAPLVLVLRGSPALSCAARAAGFFWCRSPLLVESTGGIRPGHQAIRSSATEPCRYAEPRFPRTLGFSDAGNPRISGSVARTSSRFLRPAGSRIKSKGDHFFDLVLPRRPRSSFLLVRVLVATWTRHWCHSWHQCNEPRTARSATAKAGGRRRGDYKPKT